MTATQTMATHNSTQKKLNGRPSTNGCALFARPKTGKITGRNASVVMTMNRVLKLR